MHIIALAVYDYMDRDRTQARNQALVWLQLSMIIVFGVEVIVKMVAVGVVRQPGTYLRSPWNVLDLCIVVFG